jgi:exonuclease III
MVCQVLELRLQHWLAAGRSCLIVGDLNISPAAIDSCHPAAEFDHQRCDRLWLNKMLGPQGPGLVDAFRMFHPSRCVV